MASFDKIFEELGYTSDGAEARGEPSTLFESLNSSYQACASLTKEELADHYLWENGLRMFPPSRTYLSHPNDSVKIKDLLICAFTLFQDESWYNAATEPPAKLAGAVEEQIPTADHEVSSPKDKSSVPESLDSGGTEKSSSSLKPMSVQLDYQDPISTSSKKELAALVKGWIDEHPTHRFPEVGGYSRHVLESQFACEATLTVTGETVWIVRLGIQDQYLGLVLEMPNGTYMLLRERRVRQKGYGGCIYQPWLGGDLGFSEQEIAHHKNIPRKKVALTTYARKKGLEAEDVLKEYDITRYDLDPELPRPARKKRLPAEDAVTELPMTPERKAQGKARTPTSKQSRTTVTQAGSDSDTDISATSFTSLIPLKTLWMERRKAEAQALAPTAPKRRRGQTSKASKAKAVVKTEDTPAPSNPFSFPQTLPTPSASATTPSLPPSEEATFHFLLSNPSLGAIPHTYPTTALPTRRVFFTHATNAYGIVGGEKPEEQKEEVIAASVRVAGVERPIVVRRDGEGKGAWEMVARVVREEEEKKGGGRVEVEVRCLVGGGAEK